MTIHATTFLELKARITEIGQSLNGEDPNELLSISERMARGETLTEDERRITGPSWLTWEVPTATNQSEG